MTHDDTRSAPDRRLAFAQPSASPRKKCDACLRPREMLGSRVVTRGPLRLWHCAECVRRKEAVNG